MNAKTKTKILISLKVFLYHNNNLLYPVMHLLTIINNKLWKIINSKKKLSINKSLLINKLEINKKIMMI